jgi:hypothetical protein
MKYDKDLSCPKGMMGKGLEILRISEDLGSPLKEKTQIFPKVVLSSYFIEMSLASFKKKSVILHGSNVSGKPPGGHWLPQGPFGKNGTYALQMGIQNEGPVGFSLEGSHRNVGYVGKAYSMSKSNTSFKGRYARGSGGLGGTYPQMQPVNYAHEANALGNQYMYVKPSVVSTRGMLHKKYKWAYNGQYPNNWVQPNYTGNLTDTASQGSYIQSIAAANVCVIPNNQKATDEQIGNIGGCACITGTVTKSPSRYTYNNMAANAPYTKYLKNNQDSSQYILQKQRRCTNPTGALKPFPYATNGDACNQSAAVLAPPKWYVASPSQFVQS